MAQAFRKPSSAVTGSMVKVMNRANVFEELEQLVQEPGYVYTLAFIARHDLFLAPEEAADINWRERLSFRELSLVLGLLVKHVFDTDILPTQSDSERQIARTYELFERLHGTFFEDYSSLLTQQAKRVSLAGDEHIEVSPRIPDFFGSGSFMTEPIFYGGSGAYDFQYREFAMLKYQFDEEWIQSNVGTNISDMITISSSLKRIAEDKNFRTQFEGTFEDSCRECLSILRWTPFPIRTTHETDRPSGPEEIQNSSIGMDSFRLGSRQP